MVFGALTFSVSIPSAIKVFNWLSTMYKGSISLETPMCYALAFIFLFGIGGLTGLHLGSLATDVHLHDTYFVVAHFHYVMMGGTLIAFLGGLHYWWPKMFGRMYNENLARIACLVIFVGFNATFFPQFVLGSRGMPRRYANYDAEFQVFHQFSTTGVFILGGGLLLCAGVLIQSLRNGRRRRPPTRGGLDARVEVQLASAASQLRLAPGRHRSVRVRPHPVRPEGRGYVEVEEVSPDPEESSYPVTR